MTGNQGINYDGLTHSRNRELLTVLSDNNYNNFWCQGTEKVLFALRAEHDWYDTFSERKLKNDIGVNNG